MKQKYLIDSVILIDYLNGVERANKWLNSLNDNEGAISVITFAEVASGADIDEKNEIEIFLSTFTCLSIDKSIASVAARLRQEYRWKLPDAFQAAIALSHQLVLVTRNTKDFSPKIHKFIKIPYKL